MKKQKIKDAWMAYYDEGQGHPLLMGHSFLWDHHMWSPQLATLKTQYRCIAPDLWSHGQSDPLPSPKYTLETLAEDYWQFAQALSLSQFGLIGLSVGGMWATHIALNHPKAVTALVIMDTFVGSEPEAPQKVYFGMMDELERDNQFTPSLADRVAPYFFAKGTPTEQPQLVENFVTSLLQAPPSHISGKVALGRAIFSRTSLLNRLEQIKVPTLVVVGEEDLPRPPKEAQEMAKRIPNAQLEIIPRAGHITTLERPQLVNDILNRFLRKYIL